MGRHLCTDWNVTQFQVLLNFLCLSLICRFVYSYQIKFPIIVQIGTSAHFALARIQWRKKEEVKEVDYKSGVKRGRKAFLKTFLNVKFPRSFLKSRLFLKGRISKANTINRNKIRGLD